MSRTMSLRYSSVADLIKATEVSADDVKREKIHVICSRLHDLKCKFDFAKKAGYDEVAYIALKRWDNIFKLVKKRKGPKPSYIKNITIDQIKEFENSLAELVGRLQARYNLAKREENKCKKEKERRDERERRREEEERSQEEERLKREVAKKSGEERKREEGGKGERGRKRKMDSKEENNNNKKRRSGKRGGKKRKQRNKRYYVMEARRQRKL